jgi:hypothetical protein
MILLVLCSGGCSGSDSEPSSQGRVTAATVTCNGPAGSLDCERSARSALEQQCSRDDVVAIDVEFVQRDTEPDLSSNGEDLRQHLGDRRLDCP